MLTPNASINADAAASGDTATPGLSFGPSLAVGGAAAAAGAHGDITPILFPGLPLGGGATATTPELVVGTNGMPSGAALGISPDADATPTPPLLPLTPSDDGMHPMTVAKPLPWLLKNPQQQAGGVHLGGMPTVTPEATHLGRTLEVPNTGGMGSGSGGPGGGLLSPAPGLADQQLGWAASGTGHSCTGGEAASSDVGLSSPPKCLSPDAGLSAPEPPPVTSKGPTLLQQQYQAAGMGTLLESKEAAELVRDSYVPAPTDVPSWCSDMGALRISTLDLLPQTTPGQWPAP